MSIRARYPSDPEAKPVLIWAGNIYYPKRFPENAQVFIFLTREGMARYEAPPEQINAMPNFSINFG